MLNLKKNAANIITSLRIVATAIMIFMPTLSRRFFVAYTFAGITDVLDGFVASKTGTTSKFGSKLDSLADLFFYVSMMIKILPYLTITFKLNLQDRFFKPYASDHTGVNIASFHYIFC